mmetsp:Transcript_7212/g.15993  ORF Transcript_7212/g.15993 Transcript_7212/m.15993 type:complete len:214 (-) Transcript_7212:217-858(-)
MRRRLVRNASASVTEHFPRQKRVRRACAAEQIAPHNAGLVEGAVPKDRPFPRKRVGVLRLHREGDMLREQRRGAQRRELALGNGGRRQPPLGPLGENGDKPFDSTHLQSRRNLRDELRALVTSRADLHDCEALARSSISIRISMSIGISGRRPLLEHLYADGAVRGVFGRGGRGARQRRSEAYALCGGGGWRQRLARDDEDRKARLVERLIES